MLVVTPFHPGDADQALRLAEWIKELGGVAGHNLILIRDTRCEPEISERIADTFRASFDTVEVLDFVDHYRRWPHSPNQVFGMAARHIAAHQKVPWLFLEPDCTPLTADWLNVLTAEYESAGKPFMGDFVHVPEMGDVPDHMSGNGVYPARLVDHAGLALISNETAFDVQACSQIVPQMHKSKHILHRWKHPPFENWQQVEERVFAVKPEAVLFHADKTSSLIDLLRQKRSGVQISVPASDKTAPTFTIFVKTWAQDFPWLSYCLRSIQNFAKGFDRTIIASSEPGIPNPDSTSFEEIILPEPAGSDGYLWQQIRKLHADLYTDSDFICTLDSDTIFTQPVTPENYFTDGRIDWMMTPYSMVDTPWQPITEKFLGRPVEFEFMRRAPVVLPRWIYEALRRFCAHQTGRTLEQYIIEQPHRAFSEYNAIGAFAYYFHRDKFNWINTAEVPESKWPSLTVLQKKSWDGLTPQIVAEFEEILKGGDASCNHFSNRCNAALTSEPERAAENPNIKQTKEGIWVLVNDTHISRWVEEKGSLAHDHQMLPLVLPKIPIGGTVVDGGAFVGDSTASFIERVGAEGKVFAFEPNPDARECLRRNCPSATIFAAALGNSDDDWLKMEASPNAGANHFVSGDGKENIPVVRLDAIMHDFTRLDLVKLDLEGMELQALQGAEESINLFHPKLVIEINEGALQREGTSAEEISDWLFRHGYKWRPIQPNITANSPQYDILCTHIKTEQSNSESASTAAASVVDWTKFEEDARFSSPNESPEQTVRRLAEQIKGFMGGSVATRRVRNILHEAGVIELTYRFKRRKGWKKRKAKA